MDNNYQAENPFEPRQYDFYDEIIAKDAKRATSRCMLGLFLVNVIAYAVVFAVELVLLILMGQERVLSLYDNPYFTVLLGSLPIYTFGVGGLYLVIMRVPKKKFYYTKMRFVEFLALIPISMVLMTLGNYIGVYFNMIFETVKGSEITDTTTEMLTNTPIWLTIVIAGIIGPIVEEFIFRKLLLDRLSVYGNAFAITITAIAFGLFHGNFYQLFYAAILGFVLGYVAIKSGNWLYSVLLHIIMNFIGGILPTILEDSINKTLELEELIYGMSIEEVNIFDYAEYLPHLFVTYIYSAFTSALLIGGMVLLVILTIKKKRWAKISEHGTVRIARGRVRGVVFGNVGTILFLVSSAFIMLLSILI